MRERREYPRHPSLNLVSYYHYDGKYNLDAQGVGRTLDLSKGGIKLQMEEQFPKGTTLEMTVAIGDKMVTFIGTIVFISPLKEDLYEVGIRILSLAHDDFELLEKYLEHFPGE